MATSRKQPDYGARAIRQMKESCPNCAHRIKCKHYMNREYWLITFMRPDENGAVVCRICDKFVHFMFRKSIDAPMRAENVA